VKLRKAPVVDYVSVKSRRPRKGSRILLRGLLAAGILTLAVGVFSLVAANVGTGSAPTTGLPIPEPSDHEPSEHIVQPLTLPAQSKGSSTKQSSASSDLSALETETAQSATVAADTDRPEAPEPPTPLTTAAGMAQPTENEATTAATDTLQVAAEDFTGPDWMETKIKRGDTLASIFSGFGLSPAIVHKVVNSSPEAQSLSRIRPGQTLRLKVDDGDTLMHVIHETSRTSGLRLDRVDDGGYRAEQYEHPVEKRVQFATANIDESLYLAAQQAGMSDRLTMNVAEIFGWDVDFALDIRPGDSFSVLYEEEFLNGEKLRDGAILAAEFINQGRRFGAIRYTDDEGYSEYFTPEGYSMRKAFLKTPVKFARVSSGFTRKRWHPVLKKWRAHKGVDYAAQTGTPIRATGDGKLTFVGRKGGYGKVVFIQHGGKYTTVYAHMSRFAKGMKSGTRVRQGQVIGYVGKTGYATGPHLHYEFRVNGAHKDPLRVKLPKSDPIADRHRTSFMQVAETRTNQLKTYQATRVALTD